MFDSNLLLVTKDPPSGATASPGALSLMEVVSLLPLGSNLSIMGPSGHRSCPQPPPNYHPLSSSLTRPVTHFHIDRSCSALCDGSKCRVPATDSLTLISGCAPDFLLAQSQHADARWRYKNAKRFTSRGAEVIDPRLGHRRPGLNEPLKVMWKSGQDEEES
ncbi:unnamed protein product [Pleuronectes platessa]|uniref:Uncharacterized protein n=1 Tax=Pleuronectes platessa TaxID=8262 RepID=A0A9N7VZD6_PLEPL|nr:unnamed protein product [Pleuronectes platessa]